MFLFYIGCLFKAYTYAPIKTHTLPQQRELFFNNATTYAIILKL